MSAWGNEYLQGLEDRDTREKANLEIFNSSNRTSVLLNLRREWPIPLGLECSDSTSTGRRRPILTTHEGVPTESLVQTIATLRLDLAEAQSSKGQLQIQLKATNEELGVLKDKSNREGRTLAQLSAERATFATRIRDRDEELKGKSKLLEGVQDEMLALNIQLNMADERCRKLEKENKDLIDRWMARMSREADAMNNASKFS
ncbi:hypothetical protein FGG08_006512 [Glutinoglossum americanum]|uniref:Autophagy-related protein 16 domain-containing protein n=1 Tax=Glutinoglossum americanum TaxID=1670608 RepID=A0A9P8HVX5_9PEZI|nr:hypothetical protein FGG08_006512 [Glutinoglossum americanum]